jgi:hypothetical protein
MTPPTVDSEMKDEIEAACLSLNKHNLTRTMNIKHFKNRIMHLRLSDPNNRDRSRSAGLILQLRMKLQITLERRKYFGVNDSSSE